MLTENTDKNSLLFERSPYKARYHAGQDNQEGGRALKCDRLPIAKSDNPR